MSLFYTTLILGGYAFIVWMVTFFYVKKVKNKDSFLLAGRDVGMIKGAISIAASWVWAPALFVASQQAYQNGWVGLFWFSIPNVLCLILFAPFAEKLRAILPKGYTLTEYMRSRYSNRVHSVYMFQMLGLSVCGIAVQLLAGGLAISAITGINLFWITIILGFIAVSYVLFSGLKASIATDILKMGFILFVGFIIVPVAVYSSGGISNIMNGLGGISGNYMNLMDKYGRLVFLTFGLSTTIGLLSGPFGDQTYWQRAFSIKKPYVKKSFIISAFIFAIVPLTMSLLGFISAGMKYVTTKPDTINIQTIQQVLPVWVLIPFTWMLIAGLVGVVDNFLMAISSLMNNYQKENSLKLSKVVIPFALILGILIANIPNMQVLYLFMFYGTLRASTFLPTVVSLVRHNRYVSEKGMFFGVLLAILIGLPIFAYGNFYKITTMIWGGSLITISLSFGCVLLFTLIDKWENKRTVSRSMDTI